METVQRLVLLPEEPIGQVSPYIHGQFSEHLGDCIYPGTFVGTESPLPNTRGIRQDVLEALRPLEIPVLRWPGGCFADNYHWRDGIGPREQRPTRVNTYWGMAEESNAFGTHEFIDFSRQLGAEPYFAGNVGSAAPSELRDWVEYCNFAGNSTLATERRANGSAEPFKVQFWGIGNENWGCGGNMSPEEYAAAFARYRTYVFNYPGSEVQAIACGPNSHDFAWTRRFFDAMKNHHTSCRLKQVQGFAAHYYCGTTGSSTEYTDSQWLELLARGYAIEGIVSGHRSIMDEFDKNQRVKLIVDEWGTWHPSGPGGTSLEGFHGIYMQQNTLRDACVAALTLDVFNNHADILYMANIAQLINVLQSLLLVEDDKCIKTPTYHVFDLYKPHRNGQAIRVISEAETISHGEASEEHCRSCYTDQRTLNLQAVHGSATIKDGVLCMTVVNTHPTQPVELDVELRQANWSELETVTLTADDIHACNTFAQPERVKLSAPQRSSNGGKHTRIQLPAASVVRVMGTLHA